MSYILITGGAGYIGSHTALTLLNQNYQLLIVDNLSNASEESLRRIQALSGKALTFVEGDIRDSEFLKQLFSQYVIESVIHFAGLKAVGESTQQPLRYYQNNVQGTLNLCQTMSEFKVKNLVFSSSATVYGDPISLPLTETMPTGQPTNPYGQSKLMVEHILTDLSHSDPEWNISILRYFNPVGAHPSGQIGEDPQGPPNNLMPFVAQVAVGKQDKLKVFGDDYDTLDGTGVRDYIHVEDLADGHLRALNRLKQSPGLEVFNLGTGQGYSVLEVVKAFERASGQTINYQLCPRRDGDVAINYADATKAQQKLGWRAKHTLEDMCRDSWNWQSNNPKGYNSEQQ